jgi:ectoine hydroxylase-related dioxygenase (phytanoyl-CoA dioxygenase family)
MIQPAATSRAATTPLSAAQLASYREQGYCIAENFMPAEHLALLRECCQASIDRTDAEMDRLGKDVLGISHRGRRYFSTHPSWQDPRLYRFIASERMVAAAAQLLGDDVFVFWEQYVVKGADKGLHFAWHQDSGYVSDTPHRPYLTCWCALDDMSEANGSIRVLPFARAPGKGTLQPHVHDPVTNDQVGYQGPDRGELVTVPAGSVVFFTSHTLHCSGPNTTSRMRRSYLIQYSGEVIAQGHKAWGRSESLWRGGKPCLVPAAD